MKPGTSTRGAFAILVLVVCLCVSAPDALAQRSTGTILGTVQDPSGAVIPGAKVTVTHAGTNVARSVTTDQAGSYSIPALEAGTYRVTVEHAGFRRVVVSDVVLVVDQNRRVDVSMTLGDVAATVEVSAGTLHVDTDTADVSSVIPGQELRSVPIQSRNYLEAVGWRAGVVPGFESSTDWIQNWVSPGTQGAWSSSNVVTNYNVGGGRVSYNNFTIDGVTNTNTAYGNASATPSIEAIQEVKIETSYYSAESKGTSLVGVSVKSGTNSLHGSAFESFRGDILQPTDPRTRHPSTDLPYKPPYSYHQFGGTVGGPVWLPGYNGKDRTFFFVSYEYTRFRNTSISEVNQIDPAWRTGDYSNYRDASGNLILIYDPTTSPRVPFANNQIPLNRIAPQSAAYLDMFVPQAAAGGVQILALTNSYDIGNLTLRMDHNFSPKDRLYGRFNLQTTDNHETAYTNYSDGLLNLPSKNIGLTYTRIFSPQIVNEVRLAYARSIISMSPETADGSRNYAQEVGFANTSSDPLTFGVPRIFFRAGLPNLGPYVTGVEINTTNTYQVYDVLSWSRSKQNWKFGVDIRRDLDRVLKSDSWGRGGLRFWNGYTTASPSASIQPGHYFADFLLGLASYARISVPRRYYPRLWESAFFAQADWAVAPSFTLNLGLRYEYATWPVDKEPGGMELDLSVPGGQLLTPNQQFVNTVNSPIIKFGSRPGVIKSDRNDFAPRIGLAWRPFGGEQTVIRAGYGLFYVKANDWYTWERSRPPDLETAPNPLSRGRSASGIDIRTLWAAPTPTGTSLPYWATMAMMSDSRHPYSQQWSLGVQRMLPLEMLLDVRYQGRTGTKLPIYLMFNQAPPDPTGNPQDRVPYSNFTPYSAIICYCTSSNYHAMQLELQRRLAKGLAFTAAYTWSKSIDVGSEVQGSGATSNIPNQSHNLAAERGVSNYDVPHRFVATYTYQLPFGRGRRWMGSSPGWVDAFLGGWETSGVVTFMSGRPWTPVIGYDNSNSGLGAYGYAERGQQVSDPTPPGFQRSLTQWIDPNSFTTPAYGTFGNAGRNILRGVDTRNWDLTAQKNFKLREGMNLEFRASWYNVTGRFGNGAIPDQWVEDGPGYFGAVVFDPDDIWAAAYKQLSIKLTF